MTDPIKEYLMLCDLMVLLQQKDLNVSQEAEVFLMGLWYEMQTDVPFLEQVCPVTEKKRTEGQRNWLDGLWKTHCLKTGLNQLCEDF